MREGQDTPKTQGVSWKLTREEGRLGTGNWAAFPKPMIPRLLEAAKGWKQAMDGVSRPWLCWTVDEEWCLLQQRLVASVGWTPVVGSDGTVARPQLIDGAVFVDFNRQLELPAMWMNFVMELVHHYCSKLAFWHSDVLPPVSVMKRIASQFESIEDGELVAVRQYKSSIGAMVRRILKGRRLFFRRWFEVTGCTTAGASRSMYQHGCGWWRNNQCHPNAPGNMVRARPHWEHGVGVYHWHRLFGNEPIDLCVDILPYHYAIGHPAYRRRFGANREILDSKQAELRRSFDLDAITRTLGLSEESDRE